MTKKQKYCSNCARTFDTHWEWLHHGCEGLGNPRSMNRLSGQIKKSRDIIDGIPSTNGRVSVVQITEAFRPLSFSPSAGAAQAIARIGKQVVEATQQFSQALDESSRIFAAARGFGKSPGGFQFTNIYQYPKQAAEFFGAPSVVSATTLAEQKEEHRERSSRHRNSADADPKHFRPQGPRHFPSPKGARSWVSGPRGLHGDRHNYRGRRPR